MRVYARAGPRYYRKWEEMFDLLTMMMDGPACARSRVGLKTEALNDALCQNLKRRAAAAAAAGGRYQHRGVRGFWGGNGSGEYSFREWLARHSVIADDTTFSLLFKTLVWSPPPPLQSSKKAFGGKGGGSGRAAETLLSLVETAHHADPRVHDPPNSSQIYDVLQCYNNDAERGVPRAALHAAEFLERLESSMVRYYGKKLGNNTNNNNSNAAAISKEEVVRWHNSVIKTCGATVVAEEKRDAFRCVMDVYDKMMARASDDDGDGGAAALVPDAVTFSCMFSCVRNLTATVESATNGGAGVAQATGIRERNELVKRILDDACRLGQVNHVVVLTLKRASMDVFRGYHQKKEHGMNVKQQLWGKRKRGVGGGAIVAGTAVASGEAVDEMEAEERSGSVALVMEK